FRSPPVHPPVAGGWVVRRYTGPAGCNPALPLWKAPRVAPAAERFPHALPDAVQPGCWRTWIQRATVWTQDPWCRRSQLLTAADDDRATRPHHQSAQYGLPSQFCAGALPAVTRHDWLQQPQHRAVQTDLPSACMTPSVLARRQWPVNGFLAVCRQIPVGFGKLFVTKK